MLTSTAADAIFSSSETPALKEENVIHDDAFLFPHCSRDIKKPNQI